VRGPLRWDRDGGAWPLREHSRRIAAAGLDWHVQVYGAGPPAVLVHGTGAATHTWRDLGPRLAEHWTVVAPDLPGHGFTEALPAERMSLPGMARALGELVRVALAQLAAEGTWPGDGAAPRVALAVGHSAGAAILARAALDAALVPGSLVSLNGALQPWRGPASMLFAPLARVLASTSVVPSLFARRAEDRRVVERLVANTGSRLDSRGLEAYAQLVRTPAHVAGALRMMANWDVAPLERDLPRIRSRCLFLAGADDRTVPPSESRHAHERVAGSALEILPRLGHLAHEEAPDAVAASILRFAAERAPRPAERGRSSTPSGGTSPSG
jgi:magnesium chelatase accessory protein